MLIIRNLLAESCVRVGAGSAEPPGHRHDDQAPLTRDSGLGQRHDHDQMVTIIYRILIKPKSRYYNVSPSAQVQLELVQKGAQSVLDENQVTNYVTVLCSSSESLLHYRTEPEILTAPAAIRR